MGLDTGPFMRVMLSFFIDSIATDGIKFLQKYRLLWESRDFILVLEILMTHM